MRLRIIAGKGAEKKWRSKNGIENLYVSPDLLVQGDRSIDIIKKNGEVRAMFVGHVIGRRNGTGMLSRIEKTHSDFQTLLCESSLETCINELEGRFIIVRIGKDKGNEICCDRYGQVDLYYQEAGDVVLFATDLSLLPLNCSTVEYDPVAVAHSLYIYGFRPAKRHTLYSGVKRLGVGEVVSWKNGEIRFREIPPYLVPADKNYSKQELVRYSENLMDAVEKRSSSNGNIVYLSSGWDSTSILAILVKFYGASKVKTVVGRMHYSKRKGVINPFELERAKAFADYFGVKLEIVELDWWQRGVEHLRQLQPFLRSHMLSGMSVYIWDALATHVSNKYRGEAVFCGEISDGVHNFGFSQYASILKHPDIGFREYADKMALYLFGPTFYKSVKADNLNNDIVYNLFKEETGGGAFDEPSSDPNYLNLQFLSSMFLRDKRIPFWSLKNCKIMTEHGRQLYRKEMETEYLNDISAKISPETLYSCYQHLYNTFHWQCGTVASIALTANRHGFEISLPYYDSRIYELLAATPECWGRGLELRPTKYAEKWFLTNCIDYPGHLQQGPHSYLYDVDPTFSHAGEFIYASSFAPLIKKMFKQRSYEELLSQEYFNLEYFDQIVGNYLEGKEVISERTDLSALAFLCLSSWY